MSPEEFDRFYQDVISESEKELLEVSQALPEPFTFDRTHKKNISVSRLDAVKKWVEIHGKYSRDFFEKLQKRKSRGVHDYLWYMAERVGFEKENSNIKVSVKKIAKENDIPLTFLKSHIKKNKLSKLQLFCDHDYEGYAGDGIWYNHCGICNMCGIDSENALDNEDFLDKADIWKEAIESMKK